MKRSRPSYLGDYLNLAEKASKVRGSGDTKDIAELHDLNLNTKLAVAEFPIVFTFETDAKYGVYKVLLYADSNTTSIAGFTIKVDATTCNDTTTSGLDKAELLCTDNLGGKTLTVTYDGAGAATDLAQVVIAGQLWTQYKCMPGWFSVSGNHTEDVEDCAECVDGTANGVWGFAGAACTTCKVPLDNVFYSNTAEHRKTKCAECAAPKVANTANTNCVECAIGKGYLVATGGNRSCEDCEAGKFRTGSCPVGTACPCLECDDGWVQTLEGQSSCVKCEAGFMGANKTLSCMSQRCHDGQFQAAAAQTECDDCPAGTYTPATVITDAIAGFVSCTDCLKGTYQDNEKSSECKPATAGYYVDTDQATDRKECAAGSYSKVDEATECTLCPAGKYQDLTKQSGCKNVLPGYFTESKGSSVRSECQVGQYSEAPTNTECMICQPGMYQDAVAQSECKECPLGTYNDQPEQAACKPCPSPLIANTTGQTECYFCPLGMNWTSPQQCDECVAGKHNNVPESGFCKDCDVHYNSSAGAIMCEPCEFDQFSNPGSALCTTFTKDSTNDLATECDTTHALHKKRCEDAQLPGCYREMVESAYGDFYWPFVLIGEEVKLECTFDEGLEAVRYCKLDNTMEEETGIWANPVYGCITSKATARIENILKEYENDTTLEKANSLKNMTEKTEEIGRGDIKAVGDVVSNILSNESNVDITVIGTVVDSVSNLLTGDLEGSGETQQLRDYNAKLVGSLKKITKLAPPDVIIASPRLVILKATSNGAISKLGLISFNVPVNGDLSGVTNTPSPNDDSVPLLIIESGDQAGTSFDMEMDVVMIADASLFVGESTVSSEKALEDGADALLKNIGNAENATEKVTFVNSMVTEIEVEFKGEKPADFKLNLMLQPSTPMGNFSERKSVDSSGKTIAFAYECASYHPQKNMWIKDCDTVSDPDAPEKGVLCNCKHNTSFAVLMSAFEIDKAYADSQTILTQVLLGLSTVGLIITLALMLPPKNLRTTRSAKINICFSIALLLASVVFLIQDLLIDGKHNTGVIKIGSIGCAIYTMIQHYLWLVVFMWMGVEGFLMYLSLVQVFGSHISKYMLKFNLLAWGLPLPLPIIGYFAFSKTTTVGEVSVTKNSYLADSMCFIRPESIPFFTLFLAPLIITILVNIVFFALVCKVIKSSKSSGTVSDNEQLLRQLKAAVGVMVLLGTGWFFGIFMSIPGSMEAQLAMQYIFILLNSTQGVFVFVFYVALNDQVKNHWMVKFGLKQETTASTSKVTAGKSGTQTTGAASGGDNIYANAAATEEDHTYSNAEEVKGTIAKSCEFPAKSEDNCNI